MHESPVAGVNLWDKRLVLARHNLHCAFRNRSFDYFTAIQARYAADGYDPVADLKKALRGDAAIALEALKRHIAQIVREYGSIFLILHALFKGARSRPRNSQTDFVGRGATETTEAANKAIRIVFADVAALAAQQLPRHASVLIEVFVFGLAVVAPTLHTFSEDWSQLVEGTKQNHEQLAAFAGTRARHISRAALETLSDIFAIPNARDCKPAWRLVLGWTGLARFGELAAPGPLSSHNEPASFRRSLGSLLKSDMLLKGLSGVTPRRLSHPVRSKRRPTEKPLPSPPGTVDLKRRPFAAATVAKDSLDHNIAAKRSTHKNKDRFSTVEKTHAYRSKTNDTENIKGKQRTEGFESSKKPQSPRWPPDHALFDGTPLFGGPMSKTRDFALEQPVPSSRKVK